MKECRSCREQKEREEFYRKAQNVDGLTSYCKQCVLNKDYYQQKERVLGKRREYREKNKEKISLKEALKRLSDPDRFEKNKIRHFDWSKNNRERINAQQREWYRNNKEKRRAHVILNRAIKAGEIMRASKCTECLKECKPDGHHIDYLKPLDVIWLCRACHSRKSPRTVIP